MLADSVSAMGADVIVVGAGLAGLVTSSDAIDALIAGKRLNLFFMGGDDPGLLRVTASASTLPRHQNPPDVTTGIIRRVNTEEYAGFEYAGLPVTYADCAAAQRFSLPGKARECHYCPLDLNDLLAVGQPGRRRSTF